MCDLTNYRMNRILTSLFLLFYIMSCTTMEKEVNRYDPVVQITEIHVTQDTTIASAQFHLVNFDVYENVTLTFGTVMISSSSVNLRVGASISVIGSANFHDIELITNGENELCSPLGGSIVIDGVPVKMPEDGSCLDLDDDLPVELLYFTAKLRSEDENVLLEWATASEINNEKFLIERSIDNREWSSIGEVEGAGNSNITLEYEFIDHDIPNTSIVYYRLIQLDFDQKQTYYGPNAISNSGVNDEMKIYPNPVEADKPLNILSTSNGIEVNIYNTIGQFLGYHSSEMNFLEIPMVYGKGMLLLEVKTEGLTKTEKIIVH